MKNLITLSILSALLLSACQKSNKYTITATGFPEAAESKMIYVSIWDSLFEKKIKIDSALVKNGQIVMEGEFQQPVTLAELAFEKWWTIHPNLQPVSFITEAGNITISRDTANKTTTISGTPLNTDYQKINQKRTDTDKASYNLYQKIIKTTNKVEIENLKEEQLKVHKAFFNNIVYNYAKANINTSIGQSAFLNDYFWFKPDQRLDLINLLPEEIRSTERITKIKSASEAQIATAEGKQYINVSGKTSDGTETALSEVLDKNEYVLLDFWASWCGPCIDEIPHMKKAYEAFHSKGFEIYGLSVDERSDDWEKALETHQMPWTHVLAEGGFEGPAPSSYGVMGIPCMVLIDKKGTIIAKDLRGEALFNKLEELLK